MAEASKVFKTSNEYNQYASLTSFRDQYQITEFNKGKNGKMYKKWIYPETLYSDGDRGPGDKQIPKAVCLPEFAEDAITALVTWAQEIADNERINLQAIVDKVTDDFSFGEGEETNDPLDDIPF